MKTEIKEAVKNRVTTAFKGVTANDNYSYDRIDFIVDQGELPALLFYMRDQVGFIHMAHATCADWFEEGKFELSFILWSPTDKFKVFVKTFIDRNNPVMENMDMIWPQLNTYEREFREMFGIQFKGLVAPDDFILEDWVDIPPFRKEFDTYEFTRTHFFNRNDARKDAKDVREEISKHNNIDMEDFIKKYSR